MHTSLIMSRKSRPFIGWSRFFGARSIMKMAIVGAATRRPCTPSTMTLMSSIWEWGNVGGQAGQGASWSRQVVVKRFGI